MRPATAVCEFSVNPDNLPSHMNTLIRTMICGWIVAGSLLFSADSALAQRDGEAEFVRQLLARSMFRSAEQFCEQNLARATTVDEKADWQGILSDCHAAHAWQAPSVNRTGLMDHTIEQITEFLKANIVHPERELRLRLQQIELLIQSVRMQDTVDQAGTWLTHPDSGSVPRTSSTTASLPNSSPSKSSPSESSRETSFRTPRLEQALLLAEALLKQLEQIRRDLDATSVRQLRERTRLAIAEILTLQTLVHQSESPPTADTLTAIASKADEMTQQLARSTTDEELRYRIAVLAAELQLNRRDDKTLELRLGVLNTPSPTISQQVAQASLRVRTALKQGHPSEGMDVLQGVPTDLRAASQELQFLELELLLANYETISILNKPEPRRLAEEQFLKRFDELSVRLNGVWLDCANSVTRRFHRVRRFGVEAVDLMADVERLEATGNRQEAINSIVRLLSDTKVRLSDSVRTALTLKTGELCVQIGDWPAAETHLASAKDMATAQSDLTSAAAADLLTIFVMAQKLPKAEATTAAHEQYRSALNQHLQNYNGLPTETRAREWLALFLKTRAPIESAEQYLSIHKATVDSQPSPGLTPLVECGRLLTQFPTQHLLQQMPSDAPDNDRFIAIRKDFPVAVKEIINAPTDSIGPSLEEQKAELVLLAAEVQLSSLNKQSSIDDWNQLQEWLESYPDRVSSLTLSAEQSRLWNARFHVVRMIHTAYGKADQQIIAESLSHIAELTSKDRLRCIQTLHTFHTAQPKHPGDLVVANSVLTLSSDVVDIVTKPGWKPSATPFISIVQLFEQQSLAGGRTGKNSARDRLLSVILSQSLDPDDMQKIAVLIAAGGSTEMSVGTNAGGAATEQFWQTILKKSPQGSDPWLEASLQVAAMAVERGKDADARRILGVVNTLYPAWGNESRKAKAQALQSKLGEKVR
ncbi:MAG: hypothetical protein JNL58_22560 [Planctomyces sp.]|nr:hypothetical protein [Planctomyces sp.]